MMEVLSLGLDRRKEVANNIFVILLFAFFNPLYAISVCAILNFMKLKFNYWFFTIMFASSFSLLFFLRDWGVSGDGIFYLQSFKNASSRSFIEITYKFIQHPHGEEPFWGIYLWLFRTIIGDHVKIFAFCNYFIIFLLTAYLAKVVDEKRFVVIILCIIFVDLGFMYNAKEVWRHMFAQLLFLIGIISLENNKNKLISRGLIYCSFLFHLLTLTLVTLYEFFNLCAIKNRKLKNCIQTKIIKWYSIEIIAYTIFVVIFFKLTEQYGANVAPYVRLSTVFASYSKNVGTAQIGFNFLFNPISYLLIFYLWFNRKHISKNDLFISINYFTLVLGMMMLDFPTSIIGRMLYVFLVGVSILAGKLILANFGIGIICIITMIIYRIHDLSGPESAQGLMILLDGEFLNPICGLIWMICNYGSILVLHF